LLSAGSTGAHAKDDDPMKTITTTALVALMTATLGLSTIAPSYAQPAPRHGTQLDNHGPRQGARMDVRRGGDFFNLARGAEAVEIALVRLSHRVELTAEQQPLFDALKTAALAAADDFAAAATALRPAPGEAATRPGLSERLDNRIALTAAQLAALEAVQPAATAFFDSLTDDQLAQLSPQRPDRPGNSDKRGQRQLGGPAAPAAPAPDTRG
jgi:hypothetical protein